MLKKEEPIHQRLNLLIKGLESGVQRRFAQRIGVASGAIGDILGQRKSKPGFDLTGKILQAYPQLRARWLLLGEGEMLKSSPAPKNYSVSSPALPATTTQEEKPAPYGNASLRILTVQVGPDGSENIEQVGARAAAGYARGGFHNQEFIEQLPSFRLPDPAYRNATFRSFQVVGDSMQSTLYEGDWVICKYIEHWDRDIRDTRVYVLVLEEGIVVKRLLNRLNNRGNLSLLSDNPAYPIRFVDPAEVREIWEAVGKLSRQFINPRYDVSTELARQAASMEEMMQRLERLESGKITN